MNYFYKLTQKEKLFLVLKGMGVVLLFSYFFYRSLWAVLPLIFLFFFYQKYARQQLIHKKQEELRQHFKEVMEMVSGNLKAGYSVENAFLETYEEMSRFYGKESVVEKLLAFIKIGMENNVPLEKRIREAGKKTGIREIEEFAGVFGVAKLSGGNMADIMGRTAIMIGEKIETEKEISVFLSARKAEQKIMNVVPFFILFYLDITSPGFFQALYHNFSGIAIMSTCLILYLSAYVLSVKMLAVEV